MTYIPRTPFRRSVDAAQIKLLREQATGTVNLKIDKWELLRLVGAARKKLDLSDRTVNVLQALLSFHPKKQLDGQSGKIVVFPSNTSICARLNGMPCSTMRRHLKHLVDAGLITRRDSPNGKRYSRSEIAFGFDLLPLLTRAQELQELVLALEVETAQYKALRLSMRLLKRDMMALADYGQLEQPKVSIWKRVATLELETEKALRRKNNWDQLSTLNARLKEYLHEISEHLDLTTDEMSTNDTQNEHHYQSSKEDVYESECLENREQKENSVYQNTKDFQKPKIPFHLVKENCKELGIYSQGPLSNWPKLVDTAKRVSTMMGISDGLWNSAVETMGLEQCAVTIGLILERFSEIKSPGAYLRHLSEKARLGTFSPLPMLLAVSNRHLRISSQL